MANMNVFNDDPLSTGDAKQQQDDENKAESTRHNQQEQTGEGQLERFEDEPKTEETDASGRQARYMANLFETLLHVPLANDDDDDQGYDDYVADDESTNDDSHLETVNNSVSSGNVDIDELNSILDEITDAIAEMEAMTVTEIDIDIETEKEKADIDEEKIMYIPDSSSGDEQTLEQQTYVHEDDENDLECLGAQAVPLRQQTRSFKFGSFNFRRDTTFNNSDTDSSNDAQVFDCGRTPPHYLVKCPITKCGKIIIISKFNFHVLDKHSDLVREDTVLDFLNTFDIDVSKNYRKRHRICRRVVELRLFNNVFHELWLTQIPVFLMTRIVTVSDIGGLLLYNEVDAPRYFMVWFIGINFKQLKKMCIYFKFSQGEKIRKLKLYCIKMPQEIVNVYVSGAAVLYTTQQIEALRTPDTNLVQIKYIIAEECSTDSEKAQKAIKSLTADQ